MIKTIFKTTLLLIVLHHVNAQLIKNPKAFVSAGVFLSTSNQNPFWIRSNQYGIVPLESQVLQLRGGYKTEYDSTKNIETHKLKKKFDYAFGAELVGNIGNANQFIIPEAYFKTRLGAFEFYAGRRREIVGLVDTLLTSGSYIWSGNALPIPKIQISIPNYTSILGKGLVSIKGTFAHGWFENNRPFTKHVKLHQKSFYGKLGRDNWKMNFYGGFNHNVQWGGESPFYSINGKLPDGFRNYIHVLLGTRGAITNSPENFDFDSNRVGNHLGTIDLGVSFKFKKNTILVYRQNIYEDGSLFYLNNINDGLNGISINLSNKVIKKLNFEFLNTFNQGGNEFKLIDGAPPELRGSDSYFNNAQFADGWSYNFKTIGTPLILSAYELENTKNVIFTKYNRTQAFSFSSIAELNAITFFVRLSHFTNLGSYTETVPRKTSNSFWLNLKNKVPYKNIFFTLSLNYESTSGKKNILGTFFSANRIIK
ncbi:MAG: capsule assembly Wzi family protein [Spirosomataceae bacterium]